ncbi:hypothetical protein [Methylobacterium sp. WL6]|uniref:hypothetical protein n=1 Tax=Methylobacterium sp. WL6 TaxID=2603901 RepID=UPI0011C990B4|nr:hypothetical protein [Methylobacterium sp. WL6]TXN62782.1 hypothetical protein FV230_21190 [Methylobacterium sp. WL6]
MLDKLISSAAFIYLFSSAVQAHALFPGRQVVYTAGERAIAYFQTNHDGKKAQEYRVELFDVDRWVASSHAVASQEKIAMGPYSIAPGASNSRRFSVMVDLSGQRERTIRVCTKSIAPTNLLEAFSTAVNTRVCSTLVARRI